MKYIETYNDSASEYGDGQDIEVWECERCGRRHSIYAGGDIACCPCEFEEVD